MALGAPRTVGRSAAARGGWRGDGVSGSAGWRALTRLAVERTDCKRGRGRCARCGPHGGDPHALGSSLEEGWAHEMVAFDEWSGGEREWEKKWGTDYSPPPIKRSTSESNQGGACFMPRSSTQPDTMPTISRAGDPLSRPGRPVASPPRSVRACRPRGRRGEGRGTGTDGWTDGRGRRAGRGGGRGGPLACVPSSPPSTPRPTRPSSPPRVPFLRPLRPPAHTHSLLRECHGSLSSAAVVTRINSSSI
jgi:hypothetical protein